MRHLPLLLAASCASHCLAQDARRVQIPETYRSPTLLSGDGSIVTSSYIQPFYPYRWAWLAGTVTFPFPNQRRGEGLGLSRNGSILVGWWDGVRLTGNPFINANGQTTDLGIITAPGAISRGAARAVSDNGQTVVGWFDYSLNSVTYSDAFVWRVGAISVLPDMAGGQVNSRAYDPTADGRYAVGSGHGSLPGGFIQKQACVWDLQASTIAPARLSNQITESVAMAVSTNGLYAVGYEKPAALTNAARWSISLAGRGPDGAGSAPFMIPIPGEVTSIATGISGDGSIIVGNANSNPQFAWIWDAAHGGRRLDQVLAQAGIQMPCALTDVHSISDDAMTMTVSGGCGNFVVRLGGPCGSADFDGNGDAGTDADIEAFFACLAGNCCPACGTPDFNHDGDVATDADIESFFRVLAGGHC